jgi:hypothetical protein
MTKSKKNSHFDLLKQSWLEKHKKIEQKIIKNHGHLIASLIPRQQIIGGLMLAVTPLLHFNPGTAFAQLSQTHNQQEQRQVTPADLVLDLNKILPESVRPFIPQEEENVLKYLSETFKIKLFAEKDGIRLDRNYGLIGKEQHLRRYFGDSLNEHFNNNDEAALYSPEGIAPGLGAWGYFANSSQNITEEEKLREKYYIAVPTFLAPGFNENPGKFGLFFKYRKMLVVNPENGKAIIADIADAGPSKWTGKHLGGSPEVMNYLERVDGAQKGPVIYFFIEEPNDTIPLGPIKL